MDRIRALRNPIRHYPWGSHTALAEWSGRPAPSDEPEAELWLGAHPSAPSEVVTGAEGGTLVPLDRWIARDPVAALGQRIAKTFDAQLPFLLKVLAPSRALSVQTHPDAERARRGFDRENESGLPIDHPERSYRDPRPKPELICALTGFSALCGFQEREEATSRLRDLAIPSLEPICEALQQRGTAAGLSDLLKLPAASRQTLATAVVGRVGVSQADDPVHAMVQRLARQYPGDIGTLAPLFLNAVTLTPGEALFLEAGLVHAYLDGFGIEVMGNSDNTLRGGLTGRHVDVPEFVAALDPSEATPPRLRPVGGPGQPERYPTPAASFALQRLDLAQQGAIEMQRSDGPEIWLCTAGRVRVEARGGPPAVDLPCGHGAWVPASAGALRASGDGVLHIASAPG